MIRILQDRIMSNRARLGLVAVAVMLAACDGSADGAPSASSAVPLPSQPMLGAFPSDLVDGLRTEVDVAYTDVVQCGATPCLPQADVLAPADGANLPTVVLLNGGGPLRRRRHRGGPRRALVQESRRPLRSVDVPP